MVLNCLGEVAGTSDGSQPALEFHIRAWRRARLGGCVVEQARALRGMAAVAAVTGRVDAAARLAVRAAALSGAPSRA
jgi:hypothetical protein